MIEEKVVLPKSDCVSACDGNGIGNVDIACRDIGGN